jgi:hypothetical protein
MIKNTFLTLFLLFLATFAFSQHSFEYELSLKKKASAVQEEINFKLNRVEDGVILIIKEKVFPEKGSTLDSLYLTSVLEKPSDEKKILLQEFIESKTSFVSDSMLITDKKVLEEIDFLVSQWSVLVDQSTLKNPNRFVLDGTSFSFSLTKENQVLSRFSIHSPDDQTHPEISRLLRSIESISKEF